MSSDINLVEPDKLRGLIAELELGDKQRNQYLEARWLKYIEWWDRRANEAKLKYRLLRSVVVIGSAVIPALVGLREIAALKDHNDAFSVWSIIVSLLIAACASLESVFGYGEIWREKRNAAELIKSEGFCFLQLTGIYKAFRSHAEAYQTFAGNVEDLIVREIKDYIVAVNPMQRTSSGNSPAVGPAAPTGALPGPAPTPKR